MARKDKPKKKATGASGPVRTASTPSKFKMTVAHWAVLALGFLLYANTISFQFALDDKLYITYNNFTKKGISGIPELWTNELLTGFYGEKKNLLSGGRYRPLSLTTHAIEWELLGPDLKEEKKLKQQNRWTPADEARKEEKLDALAHVGHFINAVFYGLTGLMLFIVLCRLFPPDTQKQWFTTFAFVASAIFIAHPLHTEVVANIKSRDEIMSVLGSLCTLFFVIRFLQEENNKDLALASVCMMLSLFSKESSITFLGIIPLTAYFFTKAKLNKIILATGVLGAFSVLYILVRGSVVGWDQAPPPDELMNDPFLGASGSDRLATVVYTMGIYIKLLFFPHPLTHDYYPYHIPIVSWSHPGALMSVITYIALIAIAIKGLIKKTMFSYGILLYLGSFILFSNFFFSIGTFMNERFMYIPSIGFGMIVAYLLTTWIPCKLKNAVSYQTKLLPAILLILLTAAGAKTIHRNQAWENDNVLALTDAQISVNSAKVNMSAGSALLTLAQAETNEATKRQMLRDGVRHLRHSLEIYPTYVQSLHLLGTTYFELLAYDSTLYYYNIVMQVNPNFNDTKKNLEGMGNLCAQRGAYDASVKAFNTLLYYHPNFARGYSALGEVYGKYLSNFPKALEYLNKAEQLEPNSSDIVQKVGVVYAMTGRTTEALQKFNRALELSPNNANILMNIGVIYRQLGDQSRAKQYLDEAIRIKPELSAQINGQ